MDWGCVAQVVEQLPRKHKALSLNIKEKKKKSGAVVQAIECLIYK
jgi:hypothetical protein